MAIEKEIIIDVESAKANKSLAKLTDAIKDVNKEAEKTNKETAKGLDNLDDSAKKTSKGIGGLSVSFKGLGTAMKAAGIGLVIAALAKLSEIFTQNQKVADAFNVAFEAVSIAFNDFVNFILNNTKPVIDFFKDLFENPLDNIKAFGKAIQDNLTERFNSFLDTLGFVSSAIKKVFSGDFSGALDDIKKAGKESLDVLTGVNDSFDKGKDFIEKSTEAIKNYTAETIKSAKENVELANTAQLAAAQQALLVEKYDIQAEKLRQIRDEERNSIEERKKANDELLIVLEKQEKAMLAQANAQVASAQAELNKNASIENQVALTDALANKQGILAQIEGFRSEQKANDLALDREQVELTNSKLESESKLSIERKRFNAEQIEDEVARLEALKQIDLLEAEQEAARLQAIVDNANAGTQAKIDAQIALDEFTEESRQRNIERDREISEARTQIAQTEAQAKQQTFNDTENALVQLGQIAGQETAAGKALSIASATINTYRGVSDALAAKTVTPFETALKFINAASILSNGLQNVRKIAAVRVPSFGGGASASAASSGGASQPPQFNIVGQDSNNQLAQTIAQQENQPVQAYVVANDVTTAQSLNNNIVEGATL